MTADLQAKRAQIDRGRDTLQVPADVKSVVRGQILSKIMQRRLQLWRAIGPEDEVGLFRKADELLQCPFGIGVGGCYQWGHQSPTAATPSTRMNSRRFSVVPGMPVLAFMLRFKLRHASPPLYTHLRNHFSYALIQMG